MHVACEPAGGEQSWSRRLRLQAAYRAGVSSDEAALLLDQLTALEPSEYLKTSAGLRTAERQAVLALRGRLRGLDPAVASAVRLDSSGEVRQALRNYWPWLIYTASPPGEAGLDSARDRLPGDLAAAIGREPDRWGLVLETWHYFAGLIGIDAGERKPALNALGELLRRCRPADAQAPTKRSFDIAVEIARLTGLPEELIEAHLRQCHDQLEILWETIEWYEASRRRASMAGYQGATAAGHRNGLPRPGTTPEGRPYLVLASAEYAMLTADISSKVFVRLVSALRLGAEPAREAALRSTQTVYLDRMHGKRDSDGVWIPTKLRGAAPDPEEVASPEPPTTPGHPAAGPSTPPPSAEDRAAAADFAVAQEWLSATVDRCMSRLGDHLLEHGPAAIFPTRAYGNTRSASLGQAHLRAAQNCLQYLACTARLEGRAAVLAPSGGDPTAEFSRHMRATEPARWNGSPNGRKLTGDYVGAVAWAAWRGTTGMDAADAPEVAASIAGPLLAALQDFAALAALDGMVGMMRRFARPTESPRPGWMATITEGADAVAELTRWLAGRASLHGHPTLRALAGQVRELGLAYRDAGRAAARDEVVADADHLIRLAETLAAMGSRP